MVNVILYTEVLWIALNKRVHSLILTTAGDSSSVLRTENLRLPVHLVHALILLKKSAIFVLKLDVMEGQVDISYFLFYCCNKMIEPPQNTKL